MKLIRSIPLVLCVVLWVIVEMHFKMSVATSFLGMIFMCEIGYAISHCITTTFPEDEASPYFQIHLNKVVISIISIVAIIGGIILFNTQQYDWCLILIWVYFSIFSGYISSEFDKA